MQATILLGLLPMLALPIEARPAQWPNWGSWGDWNNWNSASSSSSVAALAAGQAAAPTTCSQIAGTTYAPTISPTASEPASSSTYKVTTSLAADVQVATSVHVSASIAASSPAAASSIAVSVSGNSNSTGGMVFAHYMLISRPISNDYATDMIAAKAMGIDAFAVNYGGFQTDYEQQNAWLTELYNAAAANGMKAFLSIDTTIQPTITPDKIVNLTKTFASHPAQLQINGQPLLTSFELGPPTTWNWKTDVLSKVSPTPMFLGCSLSSDGSNTLSLENSQGSVGSVTWLQPTLSPAEQKSLDEATSKNKGNNKWLATVAAWYFKRLSADMNWAQAQDDAIFVDRFANLLTLDPRPDFIELTTWNDFGESHYIGPAPVECDSCYYGTLNHTGFQRLAQPFIKAFKSGATAPIVENEEVFMFYRTQKASANDNTGLPLPQNSTSLKDEVFVVGALKNPATVTVVTGPTTTTVALGAGVQKTGIPFAFGAQSLSGTVGGKQFSKTGPAINQTVTKVNDNIVIV